MKLVTRCDDLGSFHAANRAILDAVERGLARNVGFMVPAAAFAEAAEMFRNRKDACLGLHATLNSEWENVRWKPILPPEQVPTLLEKDGTLRRSTLALFEEGVVFEQMLAEITAQLQTARKAGLNIQYQDSHCGFSWVHTKDNPKVRFHSVLESFAQREGLLLMDHDPDHDDKGFINIKGRLVPFIGFEHQASAWAGKLCAALRDKVQAGAEVCFLGGHPARPDAEMQAVYEGQNPPGRVARERERDWQALVHPQVLATCRELDIRPVKVTEL